MLNIVASYHRIQFQGKCMIQTQKNGKKPHAGSDLRPLHPILGRQFFFFTKVVVGHWSKLQSYKTLSEKMTKKLTLDPILTRLA